jgi:putative hemolysin
LATTLRKKINMQLITANDLSRAIGTERFPVKGISNVLLKVLKLNEINELYQHNQQREGVDFIEHLLAEINVHIQFDEKELERIPKTGPFITISNHPFGAIDGLILLAMVAKVRPDFKIMANFLLTQIDQLKNYVFPVNPFNNKKGGNINGIKNALQHLKNGYPLGIFPAGEVSSFKNITSISDKEWSPSILKFIEKAKVPVVPIYFHGSNSMAFHLLGLINPYLRTAKLPSELMNKKNKSISVRIGKSISEAEQHQFVNTHQVGRFLRAKTYSLGSTLDVQKFYRLQIPKKEKPIIAPISK